MLSPRRHWLRVLIYPGIAATSTAGSTTSTERRRAAVCRVGSVLRGTTTRTKLVHLAERRRIRRGRDADVEHGAVAEIHRHLVDREPVRQWARHVAQHTAQNRALVDQPRSRDAMHARRQIVLREDRRGSTLGDDRAALLHEIIQHFES